MDILHAILLGILEGFTEFLPISSTGHLIIAEKAIGFYDASKLFTVVVQAGAILAVIWFYRIRLLTIFTGLFKRDKTSKQFFFLWLIATIPAGLIGLLFGSRIELFSNTLTIAFFLIVGGIIIAIIEKYKKNSLSDKTLTKEDFTKITIKKAIAIGLYQSIALLPGVSRSGSTIIGGLLVGLDRVTATAFSFFLSLPIIIVASIYKLTTNDISIIPGGLTTLLMGVAAAFFSALFAIKWLIRYVSKHSFMVFAYYRIIFGLFLIFLIKIQIIE